MRKYEITILGQDNEGLMVLLDRATVTADSLHRAVDKLSGMYMEGPPGAGSDRFRGDGPIRKGTHRA